MLFGLIFVMISLSELENSMVNCEEELGCFEEFPPIPQINFSQLDFDIEIENRFCINDSELIFNKNSSDFHALFGSIDDFFKDDLVNSFNITEILFNFEDSSNSSCSFNYSDLSILPECSTTPGKQLINE